MQELSNEFNMFIPIYFPIPDLYSLPIFQRPRLANLAQMGLSVLLGFRIAAFIGSFT